METYLKSTKYAAEGLFDLIHSDFKLISDLNNEMVDLETQIYNNNLKFQDNDMTEDGCDVKAQAYFQLSRRASVDLQPLIEKHLVLNAEVEVKQTAIRALSGAFLQIAHQGIVSVCKERAACSIGREIGETNLRDVIWESRNQSMHFNDKLPYRDPIKNVFLLLRTTASFEHDLEKEINLAFAIIHFLDWNSFANYEADMMSLHPN